MIKVTDHVIWLLMFPVCPLERSPTLTFPRALLVVVNTSQPQRPVIQLLHIQLREESVYGSFPVSC